MRCSPPCGVDGLRLVEREDTHGDGADLVVSAGDEVAGMGAHFDQGALRDFGLLLGRDVVYGTPRRPRGGGAAGTLPYLCADGFGVSSFVLRFDLRVSSRRS